VKSGKGDCCVDHVPTRQRKKRKSADVVHSFSFPVITVVVGGTHSDTSISGDFTSLGLDPQTSVKDIDGVLRLFHPEDRMTQSLLLQGCMAGSKKSFQSFARVVLPLGQHVNILHSVAIKPVRTGFVLTMSLIPLRAF